MIAVPKIPKPKRRRVEDTFRDDAVAKINAIEGCWAAVNDTKAKRLPNGTWKRFAPLGEGSADIIFSVPVRQLIGLYYERDILTTQSIPLVGRIGWIECKAKGRGKAAKDAHQRSWAEAMRRKGHFVAEGVTSVEDALRAVERCRYGEMR